MSKVVSLDDAVALVPDSGVVAFGGSSHPLWRRPVAFALGLARAGRPVTVVQLLAGIETDLVVDGGAAVVVHTAGMTLAEAGSTRRFRRAVKDGRVEFHEHTEHGLVMALRAAALGLTFLPWRVAVGSDVPAGLGLAEITCPYTGEAQHAVRPLAPDVAVIQARRCDEVGNVPLTSIRDSIVDYDRLVCSAADRVVVCAEEVGPVPDGDDCLVFAEEVDAVVHAPGGARPGGLYPDYEPDGALLAQYAALDPDHQGAAVELLA